MYEGSIWYTPVPQNFESYEVVQCVRCQALVYDSQIKAHDQFHKGFTNRTEEPMSSVLWCDVKGHSFKAGERGSQSFTGTLINEKGERETVQMDVCSEHAAFNFPGENATPELEE